MQRVNFKDSLSYSNNKISKTELSSILIYLVNPLDLQGAALQVLSSIGSD